MQPRFAMHAPVVHLNPRRLLTCDTPFERLPDDILRILLQQAAPYGGFPFVPVVVSKATGRLGKNGMQLFQRAYGTGKKTASLFAELQMEDRFDLRKHIIMEDLEKKIGKMCMNGRFTAGTTDVKGNGGTLKTMEIKHMFKTPNAHTLQIKLKCTNSVYVDMDDHPWTTYVQDEERLDFEDRELLQIALKCFFSSSMQRAVFLAIYGGTPAFNEEMITSEERLLQGLPIYRRRENTGAKIMSWEDLNPYPSQTALQDAFSHTGDTHKELPLEVYFVRVFATNALQKKLKTDRLTILERGTAAGA